MKAEETSTGESDTQSTPTIENRLYQLAQRTRAEIDQVGDPRAKVLLETTAEVLHGLVKAHRHFAQAAR